MRVCAWYLYIASECFSRVNPQTSLLAQLLIFTSSTRNYNPIPAKEIKVQGGHIFFSSSCPGSVTHALWWTLSVPSGHTL